MPTSPKSAGASRWAIRISDAQERIWLDHLAAAVHATPRASDWSRLLSLSADGSVDGGAGWPVTVSFMRVSPWRGQAWRSWGMVDLPKQVPGDGSPLQLSNLWCLSPCRQCDALESLPQPGGN